MENIHTAVVIPCYKVETKIEETVLDIPEFITHIILINDASPDNTGNIIDDMARKNKKITSIHHSKNQGVGGAMKSGFNKALELQSDIIIKIDGDGQMDTSYLLPMIETLKKSQYQFVKGNRFHDRKMLKKMPAIRRAGNLLIGFLIKLASGYWKISDPTNGFFAIQRKTLKELNFNRLSNRFFFESSLIIELYYTGASIKDLTMPAIYNDEKSNLSITQTLFSFPFKIFVSFIRRIWLQYFIYDFNIASLYIFFGSISFLFGLIFGSIKWAYYASNHIAAPTGTIMLATLTLILGFQMLLSAIQYDITAKNPFQHQYE
ncbi:MAG: glycosyltransferase family 2 protein [Bacteroidales bacterium]|nr:glycosyltransferase family 2 protein [Bacteroidales bacterium]